MSNLGTTAVASDAEWLPTRHYRPRIQRIVASMITSRTIVVFVIIFLHKGCFGIILLSSIQQLQISTIQSTNIIRNECHPYCFHPPLSTTALRDSTKSFDFSSPAGWESYYRQQEILAEDDVQEDHPYDEWHSTLPLEDIASLIQTDGDCLCVGCGTSRLPSAMLQRRKRKRQSPSSPQINRIVLFDSSPSCLRLLEKRYGSHVEYVCGDATKLSTYFSPPTTSELSEEHDCSSFDIIVDKGLTDAILCSEGFDGPLGQLMVESAKVLKHGGRYLLISYAMPTSTKDFIRELGRAVGLEWKFDVDMESTAGASTKHVPSPNGLSTKKTGSQKVSVSWATRVKV